MVAESGVQPHIGTDVIPELMRLCSLAGLVSAINLNWCARRDSNPCIPLGSLVKSQLELPLSDGRINWSHTGY